MILRISQAGQRDVDIRITHFSVQVSENETFLFTADFLDGPLDFSSCLLVHPRG